jgi:hypothetical protein
MIVEEESPGSGKRIEREVIVERTTTGGGTDAPPRSSMWAWVLPLVIVVLVLMWYVVTRGEPRSLFGADASEKIELSAFLGTSVAL